MTVFTDSVISMIAVGGFLVFVSAGFALVKLRETFAKSLKRGDDVEANYGGCRVVGKKNNNCDPSIKDQ